MARADPVMTGSETIKPPLTIEEWVKDRHANCLRIAKTKPHGADRAGWLEDAEYFQAVLDCLAARVGEDWCFDMTLAPRDGTRFISITKGGIQRIDRMHGARFPRHRRPPMDHDQRAAALVSRWEHGDEKHRQWLRDTAIPSLAAAFAEVERGTIERCARAAGATTIKFSMLDRESGDAAVEAIRALSGPAASETSAPINTTGTTYIIDADGVRRVNAAPDPRGALAILQRELQLVGKPGAIDSEIPDSEPLTLSMGWIRKLRTIAGSHSKEE